MGLLDGLVGGAVGAGLAVAASKLIEQHGGIQGIVSQMETHGLGETVRSWVARGANQPITVERLQQVFGSGTLAEMAARVGLSPEELTQKLAHFLPQAVDHLTPDGTVPPSNG
jgi:uncharacterized protein YidB (DUF937 family)